MERLCECNSNYLIEDFWRWTIYICPLCKRFVSHTKQCEHEFKPYLMEISGGSYQLRLICKNCFYSDNKSKKQSDYPGTHTKKILIKYQEFLYKKEQPYWDRIKELNQTNIQLDSWNDIYFKYLESDDWKKLRMIILERDKYQCQICYQQANDVHHLTYAHLKNEYLFELISLCRDCHDNKYPHKQWIELK
jgi:hypothetical protein